MRPPRNETRFNELKLCALQIFERSGRLNPAAWAVLAGFYPIRAAYSYLLHLHRLGLLLAATIGTGSCCTG